MGEDSSLPESSARRLARVDIPVLTSGRGRETSAGRRLYGWAKFRLRIFSKNPHNARTKGAECGSDAQKLYQIFIQDGLFLLRRQALQSQDPGDRPVNRHIGGPVGPKDHPVD